MSTTSAKLSAYSAALVLVAGGAWALGTAAGPFPQAEAHGDTHGDTHSEAVVDLPGGLASAQDGYALTPATTTLTPGAATRFTFRITGPDGAPVTAFDVEHEKRLHFIVVRRDTAGYQHLHPDLGADGTWTVPLTVADAGSYRAFADFTPSGAKPLTLGVDLVAPGVFQPVELPETRVADVDGYHVRLDGDLVAGRASRLTATVTEDGRQATDLQPYLGAAKPPRRAARRRPGVPARPPGRARAHLCGRGAVGLHLPAVPGLRHGDVVRTAAFTVTTGKGAPR